MTRKTLQQLLLLTTIGIASCTDSIDNPVTPGAFLPETPEQQAFWAPFDAWKTDSCTAGDDFYMHMLGTWWKNPTDIYPQGLMSYAWDTNDQRVKEIYKTNDNLLHLKKNLSDTPAMSDEEVADMVIAKTEEFWAGATTREEALEALGRAWAEGYTLDFDPIVVLEDGVPTWQLQTKIPSYISEIQLYYSREERARRMAPRKSVQLTNRAAQEASADLDIIVKAMNIGVDHIGIHPEVIESWQNVVQNHLSTVEGIKSEIAKAVLLLDGALANAACAKLYDTMVGNFFNTLGKDKNFELKVNDIRYFVYDYMTAFYALNDYNNKYITSKVRQEYKDYCETFREAMRERLEDNQWLEDGTRQNALDKLDNIVFYVGGIDNSIPACVIPPLTGKDLIEDVRQLRKARMDGYRWAAGQSRKAAALFLDNLYYITDTTCDNAFYYPSLNIVCINPSNLCAPYMQDDYEYTLQLAFIATTIGHELTHGFDSDGAQYDKWGNWRNWWSNADAAKFEALCNQLVENYNSLQLMPWADPTLYADGKKTLGENIADLGGCCLGLHILLDHYRNATEAEKKVLTQRYFQAWAIQWSYAYGLEYVTERKVSDVHSQARERTNGVVRNMNEWYDAFDITTGTLWLQPSERVEIW